MIAYQFLKHFLESAMKCAINYFPNGENSNIVLKQFSCVEFKRSFLGLGLGVFFIFRGISLKCFT